MHHHAYLPAILNWIYLDAHSKGRCGKGNFHDATGCSVYSPFLHCKAATWRGKGQGMSRNVNMSSAGTTFSGHNLVHQCSSSPWKGSNIFRYRMSQMNIFPHFVVLCTLNDYHRLFSIDYIMHHHASSCITSSNLDLDAHSKGRCGKGNFPWCQQDAPSTDALPPLQNRCLKRQWL